MGQRPKLDVYGDAALLVLQAAVESHPEGENDHPLEEVHCHLSGEFIVTVHGDRFTDLREVRTLLEHSAAPKTERYYVYKIIDVIVDSYFPVLSDLDEEINAPRGRDRLRRRTARAAGDVPPQAPAAHAAPRRGPDARPVRPAGGGDHGSGGAGEDSHDYFRDIYDHLIRITDELDGYHEMVSGCTDLYLSTVANRQGETSKQLAIIASIFLPLSFLTGFFGMNFDWSIAHVLSGPWSFFLLGIGSMALSAGFMWWWFRRKGWTGNDE